MQRVPTKSNSLGASIMITFSKLPKPCPPIILLVTPPFRVHLTVHRILQWSWDHAWPLPGDRHARVYTVHAVSAVTSSWEEHIYTDDEWTHSVEKIRNTIAVTAARNFAIPTRVSDTCLAELTRVHAFVSSSSFFSFRACANTLKRGSVSIGSSVVTPFHYPHINIRLSGFFSKLYLL